MILFLGLHISVLQVYGYNFENIIGDLGDTRFILSLVEYNYQWLSGNYHSYWDGFFMYPEKEVISYSDNLLGITPIYALIRVTGVDMFTAFQLLLLLCHVLNFGLCYFCFYRFSGNKYGAACGAFIFAFSIALNSLHNYSQFTFRFCIPLFFYFLFNYFKTYNLKFLLYAVLALIVQFYLGIYMGYFVFFVGMLFATVFFVTNASFQKFKKLSLHVIVVAPVFFVLLLPLFHFYYKRLQTTGYYMDYGFYMQTIPRLASYFKVCEGSLAWGFLEDTNADSKFEWFHVLFPGAMVFLSLGFSIYLLIKGKDSGSYLPVLVVVFLIVSFTTYYQGHTLYGYVMKIPGIKSGRIVSRLIAVLIFFCGWLLCLNVSTVWHHFKGYRNMILATVAILLVLDNFCFSHAFKSFSKKEAQERILTVQRKVMMSQGYRAQRPFAYLHGIKKDSYIYNIDAMLAALKLRTKTVNGYSSTCHARYGDFWNNADSASLATWCGAMSFSCDSLVIVK